MISRDGGGGQSTFTDDCKQIKQILPSDIRKVQTEDYEVNSEKRDIFSTLLENLDLLCKWYKLKFGH